MSRLSLPDVVLAGAAAFFLVSLFLRWQSLCFPHRNIAGTGPCLAANGWSLPGSTAAALACLVAVGALLRRYVSTLPLLAVGMGLFVTTAGLATGEPSGVGIHSRGSGAYLGFAATALFLAVVLSRRRTPHLDRGRLLLRLPPIAVSLACVAAIAIAWWSVLPAGWERETAALSGWLSAAGLLFSLYLLWAWLNQARTTTKAGTGLVVAPLALLAALVLVLVENRDSAPTWGQGILVGLSVLLALFGWIELRRGLEDAGFSELLRVDRISEAEA